MDSSSAYSKNFSLSNFKKYKYIKGQIGNYRRGYEQHLVNTKKLSGANDDFVVLPLGAKL